MQLFKKNKKLYLYLILFLPCALYANLTLEVIDIDLEKNASIDYRIDGHFDNNLKKIIEKGIHIQIDQKIEILKKRKFLFDKKLGEKISNYSIEYHPLIKKYILRVGQQEIRFNDLDSIILEFKKLKNVEINFDQSNAPEEKYLYFSWTVNKKKLPKSFQVNIFRNHWETLIEKKINI
ncbi:MAG: DUF4390 domain-containing protein [Nitrosomonadales bacterium]